MSNALPNKTILPVDKNWVHRESLGLLLDQIQPNNIRSLLNVLKIYAVSESDIFLLNDAINKDKASRLTDNIGAHVGVWVGNMLTKAAKQEWQIPMMVACELLSGSLSRYYGDPIS